MRNEWEAKLIDALCEISCDLEEEGCHVLFLPQDDHVTFIVTRPGSPEGFGSDLYTTVTLKYPPWLMGFGRHPKGPAIVIKEDLDAGQSVKRFHILDAEERVRFLEIIRGAIGMNLERELDN